MTSKKNRQPKGKQRDHSQSAMSDPREGPKSRSVDPRESGMPGGGAGRRDEVGPTGVYPMSAGIPPDHHLEIRTPASWGQGERGAAGYEDSGGSELVMRDGQLLGGLTAGPGGEPTIDIHGGDRPPSVPPASRAPGAPSTTGDASAAQPDDTADRASRR
ncbi:MAG TPA: hypothetical protein VMH39_16685 [Gemmatimonadaceae bacterium]|nr:hypothetical protein [Gemmatimonadaceae bacterium]